MTKAVIIAGGKGERLRPFTYEIPKVLMPLHGRNIVDHVIDLFWKYQTYEIWFSLGHMGDKIRDEYGSHPFWVDWDQDSRKIIPLGTGGWLNKLSHSDNPRELFGDDFYVCNGDNLFDLDLKTMMHIHKDNKFVATIACTKVDDVSEYGSVHIDGDTVQSFEEKKDSRQKKSGWVNGGYYIFSPKIFEYVKKMGVDLNDPVSLERDLFPVLAKEGLLGAFKSEGKWFDTGTIERYDKAIKGWDELHD